MVQRIYSKKNLNRKYNLSKSINLTKDPIWSLLKNVYQLKGGILNYLKNVKKKESLWNGECFVFDNRISVKHGLVTGTYSMCSGCRKPVSPKDKKSKKYEEGVSCLNCHDNLTKTQKDRFRMRQKQINLAKKSGSKHIFQKEFK